MSVVLGEDSDEELAEWRDLASCLTDERLQAFKDKKSELNKATVSEVLTFVLFVCIQQQQAIPVPLFCVQRTATVFT